MKDFSDLSEKEILALAISLEEEDHKIYSEFAEGLRETYPNSAKVFDIMSQEENGHRHRLLKLYQEKFGNHIPLIRRQEIKGLVERKPSWLSNPLGIEKVRQQSQIMERFFNKVAQSTADTAIQQLLGDLSAKEQNISFAPNSLSNSC